MDQKIAVLFMPDNIACTEEKTPLMLQPILFCPVLTWMCAELCGRGIERLFIVSDVSAQERMKPYLPKEADVTFVDGAKHAEELLKLLEGETGSILIINGVVLPVGVFSGGAVYSAPADACCAVLREHGAFAAFPKGCEISKGFLPVGDTEELRGETVIGEHCTIGPNAMVRDCTVGDFTEINASQTNESAIGSHTTVGPFAYVRPNSTIGDHVKVGDFVEIKNSVIGNGTKISHLTYVGDSDCGERVNFGCGTVTTNYDGFRKYRCTIGDDSFIGCNTNLVAPVKVGEGSYIAAGSTITDDVPADALALARTKQTVKEGWAARRRALLGKKEK